MDADEKTRQNAETPQNVTTEQLQDPSGVDDKLLDELVKAHGGGEKPPEEPEAKTDEAEAAAAALEAVKQSDPQVSGLIHDLQEERGKRQELEKSLAELKGQIEGMRSVAGQAVEPRTAAEKLAQIRQRDGLEASDALNVGQMEEFEHWRADNAEQQRKIQQQTDEAKQKDFAAAFANRFEQDKAAATAEHSDFESVVKMGKGFLSEADTIAAARSDRPALEIYNRCRLAIVKANPALQSVFSPTEACEDKGKPPKDQPIPKTAGSAGRNRLELEAEAAREEELIEALHDASDDQLDAKLAQLAKAG